MTALRTTPIPRTTRRPPFLRPGVGRLGALLLAACVLASCGPPLGTVEHRVPGNVLGPEVAVECYGAIREQRLTDGKIPAPGAPVNDFVAALFLVPDARVTWDFGRPTRIDAVQLASDDPGTDCLSWSLDGERFTSIPLSAPAGDGEIRTRQATGLGLTVRCLRLRPPRGGGRAFAELLAFEKKPAAFPVRLASQQPPTLAATSAEIASRIRLIDWIKVGIGLGAIALVLLMRRAGRSARVWVAFALIAVGLGAYIRFGWFGGNGKILHPHDALHYYLGSKYFDELGHRELYRALATHERTHGRGFMVDRELVRNLDDNRVHPGRWTDTPEGALRARFTPARGRAFARDTDAFRRLFVLKSFHRVSIDHGYNATPFHTAWLSAVTRRVAPSRAAILAGAGLDIALLVIAVLAILWAFGPGAAAVAALLLGLGEPWSFSWTGGSFARALWIALLSGGYALLARRREVAGTVLLSVAGLLRLFPLVFLGALGVFAVTRALRGAPDARRTLIRIVASATATLAAGTALVWVTLGPGVFAAAWANARIHASLPPGNHLGLRALLMHDAPAASLTAITGWQLAVWVAALALALVLLVQRARQSETLWEALPWAAPLLFASIPLSGYDYMWLIVLAPLAAASPRRFTILIGLAALTALLAQSVDGLRPTYLAYNAVLTVALVLFFWRDRSGVVRRIVERNPAW